MSSHRILSLLVAAILLFAACGDSTGPGNSITFDWSGAVDVGDELRIVGIAGNIEFTPATGNQVVLRATKRADTDDPADVTIEVFEHAGGVTICAIYPVDVGVPASCTASGTSGGGSIRLNDLEVDFEVQIPAGVDIDVRNIAGLLTGQNLDNDVSAAIVTGNVTMTTARWADIAVVTGNITVTVGVTNPAQDMDFSVVTGNVTVTVPSAINCDVELSVVTGSVTSDFPLTEVAQRNLAGTLGTGGQDLEMSAVTGNVQLMDGG